MRKLLFNVTLAFRSIRTNKLRSGLTISIIALGIMALVGILTAIEVMKATIYSSFSSMGVNSFQVTSDVIKKKKHRNGMNNFTDGKSITYTEAKLFKERFKFPSIIGVSVNANQVATVHYGSQKTDPNISVDGVDEQYAVINDTKFLAGRNFSPTEIQSGTFVCILGEGTAKKLFKTNPAKAVGQVVALANMQCLVIGVLASKGSSMFGNSDNTVLIPINTARQSFGIDNGYLINVRVPSVEMKSFAAEEAEGTFRMIRNLPLGTENNFSVSQNNDIVEIVLKNISAIRMAAVIIGIITLLGSVIGLMNIMLVSVAERTREIGVSKALGARSSSIKAQFLTESVIISLMGGAIGVLAGMLLGNTVGFIFKIGFIVPWVWIIMGVTLCAIVGVISGIYPAVKASKLDPIVALRYE